jgi:rRNA maturation endonuclease Nob1
MDFQGFIFDGKYQEGVGWRMKYCPYCGTGLPGVVSFCPECGEKLTDIGKTQEEKSREKKMPDFW